jgi:hypothetical protein
MLMTSSIYLSWSTGMLNKQKINIILSGARSLLLVQSIQTRSSINKTFTFHDHHWIKQPLLAADYATPSTAILFLHSPY